jgi:hypothetical protein
MQRCAPPASAAPCRLTLPPHHTRRWQGLSLHTHALLKLQCFHTAAVLWAAHSSHALCDLLRERTRASEEVASLRLGSKTYWPRLRCPFAYPQSLNVVREPGAPF